MTNKEHMAFDKADYLNSNTYPFNEKSKAILNPFHINNRI
jgi:hypothetical protein